MALKGIKVLEFVGLAPAPFCGKLLADFGASVTRIDKTSNNYIDVQQHGKRTLAVDLKNPQGQNLVRRLATKYDVLIDPFRPGVMERLSLGPEILCSENPGLVYARLTGFGQSGRLSQRAGHDINYAAISGVLSMLGPSNANPMPPINILSDFAGGGLMCAFGICIALLERYRSGRGQIVDAAMIDGSAYVASWLLMSQEIPMWGKPRGQNLLDGGSFYYNTYKTKDGRYMSVGALEPQFFEIFKNKLGLPELSQFVDDKHQTYFKQLVEKRFLEKTQQEWSDIFEDTDACVFPVLDWQQAAQHPHNKERGHIRDIDGDLVPNPAPRLSRTPGTVKSKSRTSVEDSYEILKDLELTEKEIAELVNDRVISLEVTKSKL